MKRISDGNMISAAQQAKLDKKHMNRTSEPNEQSHLIGGFDFSDDGKCGLSNPCVFGKHKSELI